MWQSRGALAAPPPGSPPPGLDPDPVGLACPSWLPLGLELGTASALGGGFPNRRPMVPSPKSHEGAGALGGKLLGAGGGGFMIFYVEPGLHQQVLDALDEFLLVPFELENAGAHIAFYEPKHYSRYALSNRHFIR
mgnify:CR=1 FL=1